MTSASDPSAAIYDVAVEESEKKFWEKVKEEPFVPIGILGTVGMVGWSLMNLKKSKWPLSVALIHTRVKAQAMVVGAMTVGVTYHLLKDKFSAKKDTTEAPKH